MPQTPPGPPPPYTQLDAAQCVKGSYDETQRRFRVDAELSAVVVNPIDVNITDAADSIKIGNGSGVYMGVNADGSINVNTVNVSPPANWTEISSYNEISAVSSGVSTLVHTYTVPVGKVFYLHRVDVDGDNIAEFRLKINGVNQDRKNTGFNAYHASFVFSAPIGLGYKLNANDSLTVYVLHNRPFVGSFNARIQGLQVG